MQMKYQFFLFILISNFFYSQNLTLKIENPTIVINKTGKVNATDYYTLNCTLQNESNDDYGIVLDTLNFMYRSEFKSDDNNISILKIQNNYWDKQLFQVGVIINENEQNNVGAISHDNYFDLLPTIKQTISNKFLILKAGESYNFTKRIGYPFTENKINPKVSATMLFSLNMMSENNLKIFLFQNKKLILKNASNDIKKIIRKEKLKLYNGIIYSNKVKIKFE